MQCRASDETTAQIMTAGARRRWRLRGVLREALVVCTMVLTAPLWLWVLCEERLTGGERFFAGCSELLSLFPGTVGIFLRRGFYAIALDRFAWDCCLGFGTTVAHRQVRIAARVNVGNRCTLGSVNLEEDVTIGSNVDLLSGRRQHGFDEPGVPIQAPSGSFQQIRIGRNSWIGNSAGSVVVKALPPRVVAVGNPAKAVRERSASAMPHEEGTNPCVGS
jgi:acetyltransferase-like isoleucine patch superfamily enzyme